LILAVVLYFFYFSKAKDSKFKAHSCLFGLTSYGLLVFPFNHLTYDKYMASAYGCEGQRLCLDSLVIALGEAYYWVIPLLFILAALLTGFISYTFWPKQLEK
jgi:hypothetical protein